MPYTNLWKARTVISWRFILIRFSGLYQTWSEIQQYETFPNFGPIFLRKGQQHLMLA